MIDRWLERGCKMKKSKRHAPKISGAAGQRNPGARKGPGQIAVILCLCGVVAGIGAAVWLGANRQKSLGGYVARPQGTLTFNKDIAPIVFNQCSVCHRPG